MKVLYSSWAAPLAAGLSRYMTTSNPPLWVGSRALAVIGKGVILADGSLTSLRRGALAERRLRVQFAGDVVAMDVPGTTVRHSHGRLVELSFDPQKTSAHQLIAHVAARFDVEDVHLDEPPIEEAIARFYALHDVDG